MIAADLSLFAAQVPSSIRCFVLVDKAGAASYIVLDEEKQVEPNGSLFFKSAESDPRFSYAASLQDRGLELWLNDKGTQQTVHVNFYPDFTSGQPATIQMNPISATYNEATLYCFFK